MVVKVLLLSSDKKLLKRLHDICTKNNYYFFYVDNLNEARNFLLNEDVSVCFITREIINNPVSCILTLRNFGCNSSFIFIGDVTKDEIRFFLKNGFYDCLSYDEEDIVIQSIIEEAVENKLSFENVRALAKNLEESNNQLLNKTRELEVEKKHLNDVIDALKLINNFIKEVNNVKLDDLESIVSSYIEQQVYDKFYFVVKNFNNTKEICITNIQSGKSLLNEALDKLFIENNYDKKLEFSLKLDNKEISVICFPLYYNKNYFGHICVEKSLKNHEMLYIELLSEHLSIHIYNRSVMLQLKEAQAQIAENEKMKAIFAMAVSLNHTINNNLLGISLNFEYIKRFCNDEKLLKSFEIIETNIKNISDIVKKLQEVKSIDYQEYLDGIKMLKLDKGKD